MVDLVSDLNLLSAEVRKVARASAIKALLSTPTGRRALMNDWSELMLEPDYYSNVAASLRKRGISFVRAYTIIFGRPPRLEHLSRSEVREIQGTRNGYNECL